MRMEIRNKVDGRTSIEEFTQIKYELARALALYLIENDLVDFEFKKGEIRASVDVNLRVKK
jgi:hypothetical protein